MMQGAPIEVGVLRCLGKTTLSGPATSMSITNLTLTGTKRYIIECGIKNVDAGTNSVAMTYNADTTATNYEGLYVVGTGAAVSTGKANSAIICTVSANNYTTISATLLIDPNNKVRAFITGQQDEFTNMVLLLKTHQWTTASTTVTSITMTGDKANGFGAGSYLRVYEVHT